MLNQEQTVMPFLRFSKWQNWGQSHISHSLFVLSYFKIIIIITIIIFFSLLALKIQAAKRGDLLILGLTIPSWISSWCRSDQGHSVDTGEGYIKLEVKNDNLRHEQVQMF